MVPLGGSAEPFARNLARGDRRFLGLGDATQPMPLSAGSSRGGGLRSRASEKVTRMGGPFGGYFDRLALPFGGDQPSAIALEATPMDTSSFPFMASCMSF